MSNAPNQEFRFGQGQQVFLKDHSLKFDLNTISTGWNIRLLKYFYFNMILGKNSPLIVGFKVLGLIICHGLL